MVLLAGLAAAITGICLIPGDRRGILRPRMQRMSRHLPGWAWVLVAAGMCWWMLPGLRVWIIIAMVSTATGVWLVSTMRRERLIGARRAETARMCGALAAQLAAGDLPDRALGRLTEDHPDLADVVHTRDIGGDVAAAWGRLGEQPGREGLVTLGRAWTLSRTTGAPLSPAVITVADHLRQARTLEQTVSAELSSARSSGRMMAGLPVIGLAMGFTTGGDPLHFLTTSWIGHLCLAGAAVLVCIGLVWTTRLGVRLTESRP